VLTPVADEVDRASANDAYDERGHSNGDDDSRWLATRATRRRGWRERERGPRHPHGGGARTSPNRGSPRCCFHDANKLDNLRQRISIRHNGPRRCPMQTHVWRRAPDAL